VKDWKEYKLNELGKVNRGKSKHRPRNDISLYGGKFPFVQTGDVKAANFYITEYSQTYSHKGLAQSKLWKKGTLCITIAANIAETAILGIDACFPDSIIGFVPDVKKSDVRFIKYHFDLLKLHLQSISQGTTQDNLSQEKLLKFTFTVPSDLKHQQRIASILSTYDELIEVNNHRIKLLEETARELYKEWFVRMRFYGHKQAKFVKGVPEGWEVVRIDSLYKTSSGGTPSREKEEYYKNGIYNWVKTGELNDSFIFETSEKISEIGLKKSSAKLFPAYTAIFAMYGNTIGQLGVITQPSATNQACCAFLPLTKEFDFEFLFMTLLLNREEIISFGMGAAQQNVNQDELKKYKILKPTKELALDFKKFVNPMFEQIQILQQQNTQLRQIRDRLLPRLISGKLDVKTGKVLLNSETETKYN